MQISEQEYKKSLKISKFVSWREVSFNIKVQYYKIIYSTTDEVTAPFFFLQGHPDIFLHEGDSFHITIPDITRRFYNRTMLRTNSTLGFRVHLSSLHGDCCGNNIVIGTVSDPRDIYQIFFNDYYNYDFSDVYVTTNEMWLDVIGGDGSSYGYVEIDVTSVNLPGIQVFIASLHIINTYYHARTQGVLWKLNTPFYAKRKRYTLSFGDKKNSYH